MRSSASVGDLMLVKAYLEFYCFQERPKAAFSPLTFFNTSCYVLCFIFCDMWIFYGQR